jgi:hypothetical protein
MGFLFGKQKNVSSKTQTYENEKMIEILEGAKTTFSDPADYKEFCGTWISVTVNGANCIWFDSSDIFLPVRMLELTEYVKTITPNLKKLAGEMYSFSKLNKQQSLIIDKLGEEMLTLLMNLSSPIFPQE